MTVDRNVNKLDQIFSKIDSLKNIYNTKRQSTQEDYPNRTSLLQNRPISLKTIHDQLHFSQTPKEELRLDFSPQNLRYATTVPASIDDRTFTENNYNNQGNNNIRIKNNIFIIDKLEINNDNPTISPMRGSCTPVKGPYSEYYDKYRDSMERDTMRKSY
jgi:hypothetical protein